MNAAIILALLNVKKIKILEAKMKIKLNPCRLCKGTNIVIERWSSGGPMYMVKCNNPDCPVPPDGYPTGRNLGKLKEDWNERNSLN